MLLNQSNVPVPVFDTTLVHCDAALTFALSEPGDLLGKHAFGPFVAGSRDDIGPYVLTSGLGLTDSDDAGSFRVSRSR